MTAVDLALGTAPLERCAAADGDGDGRVAIAELIAAVGRALDGCDGDRAEAPPSRPSAHRLTRHLIP